MATHISSAEPEKLFRYSDFGIQLDHELASVAARLTATLQHFETTCTEPGFQVGVGHLGDALGSYGGNSESVDSWVRQVGKGFQIADGIWQSVHLAPSGAASIGWPAGSIGMMSKILLAVLLPVIPDWLLQQISRLPWIGDGYVRVPEVPGPLEPAHEARRSVFGDLLSQAPIGQVKSIDEAARFHINQFEADLLVGGDGSNTDCGPTSLATALHALGLKVDKETNELNDGEIVDLARRSMMLTNRAKDGVDDRGLRSEEEHSTFTNLNEVATGARAAGATPNSIEANAVSVREAIEQGRVVIVTGTFENKRPLPWTGDRPNDSNRAPGGATKHIVAITGYDPKKKVFFVNDPARKGPLEVNGDCLEEFMRGNPGALELARS